MPKRGAAKAIRDAFRPQTCAAGAAGCPALVPMRGAGTGWPRWRLGLQPVEAAPGAAGHSRPARHSCSRSHRKGRAWRRSNPACPRPTPPRRPRGEGRQRAPTRRSRNIPQIGSWRSSQPRPPGTTGRARRGQAPSDAWCRKLSADLRVIHDLSQGPCKPCRHLPQPGMTKPCARYAQSVSGAPHNRTSANGPGHQDPRHRSGELLGLLSGAIDDRQPPVAA